MNQVCRWWYLTREVVLVVVATLLFPVLMFQQGWSGRWRDFKHGGTPKT